LRFCEINSLRNHVTTKINFENWQVNGQRVFFSHQSCQKCDEAVVPLRFNFSQQPNCIKCQGILFQKSPSQMSARFTMKRSRSNISVGLAQLKKGDVASAKAAEREVIHEEEEGT